MINWVDIILILVIALGALAGWRRGFILETIGLLEWIGSLLLSFMLYPYVATALGKLFPTLGIWLALVSFLSAFLAVRLVLGFLAGLILRDVPSGAQHSIVNKVLGIIPGIISGLITATVLALLLMVLPIEGKFADETKSSRVANELTSPASWIENKISPVVGKAIKRTIAALSVEPNSTEYVRLNYTTNHYTVSPSLEARMLQMVNEERTKKGLVPLQMDSALTAVAREHSKDMFDRGYFSHNTPEGKSPFMRLQDAGIEPTLSGENLALAQTLPMAHSGLMHSPGHRANILNPNYRKIGIGILDGGMHGLMISQEFSN